jgi:hypothetical protein
VKGNDSGGWSSDGVVLYLWRRQMETRLSGAKSSQVSYDLFIAVESESRMVWGGWPVAMMQIQCFSFGLRGEMTE